MTNKWQHTEVPAMQRSCLCWSCTGLSGKTMISLSPTPPRLGAPPQSSYPLLARVRPVWQRTNTWPVSLPAHSQQNKGPQVPTVTSRGLARWGGDSTCSPLLYWQWWEPAPPGKSSRQSRVNAQDREPVVAWLQFFPAALELHWKAVWKEESFNLTAITGEAAPASIRETKYTNGPCFEVNISLWFERYNSWVVR